MLETREQSRPISYKWDQWYAGTQFTILPSDYTCCPSAMVQQVRNEATKRGLKVHIKDQRDGSIQVEVVGPSKKALEKKANASAPQRDNVNASATPTVEVQSGDLPVRLGPAGPFSPPPTNSR